MNNNIFAKIIGSLIAIVIMGIIIFFVFQYYDKEARTSSNKHSSQETQEESDNETANESSSSDDYKIVDYNRDKEIIMVNDKKVVIDYELTDGGSVVTVNDNSIAYAPNTSTIKYLISKYYLIFYIKDYDISDLVVVVDENGDILKSFSYYVYNDRDFVIGDPLNKNSVSSAFTIKGNKLYVTYVVKDIDDIAGNELVQFSRVFDLTKEDFYNDEETDFRYMYDSI